MINSKANKSDSYIIPNKGYIKLYDVKSIVRYCNNGCNISDKCTFFEKCKKNKNYTMAKLFLKNDVVINLTYTEYKQFEQAFIDSGYIKEPIFKTDESTNSGR